MLGMGNPRGSLDKSRDAGSPRTCFGTLRNAAIVAAAAALLAACGSTPEQTTSKFSPKKYGVKGSPRMVAEGQPVPKGGGRYVVGKKYKIAGKWYYPEHDPDYKKVGLASWYGPTFHGRKTANGEVFDRNALTAAHTTMPLPSYARVTNMSNGRSMIVRVNDRGPFHGNRVIDLSERVATLLGTKDQGVGKVKVEYVGKARMDGQDEQYLMASLSGPGTVAPGGTLPGTLFAQADPVAPLATPVFGPARAPAPRPYNIPTTVASAGYAPSAGIQVAFDPAIAFEAGQSTIQVASANTFTGNASATAFAEPMSTSPANGVLGVLRVPQPATPTAIAPGSAISSYAAQDRIESAHEVLRQQAGTGLSLTALTHLRTGG
ncbi:septal ring lytic transglycosylase RlpA family protein [Roseibium sp.]|uniref:septal ring lytic transglycosylase RlpA family protein n=1 Tax=Roseibium sp. TaxID=1936156 RepID=UPI003A97622B